jgi:UDP-2,3-diacylglucosamine pyrophosphatase LpxH
MSARILEENRFIFADLHLGEGKDNNLEYFESYSEFERTIHLIIEHCGAEPITICFLGDTFDFLSVEYRGKTLAEATEVAALYQIDQIFKAHPVVIKSMRWFLSCGGKIKFFIGNHDLALVWPQVQNYIRRELAGQLKNPDEAIEFLLEERKSGVYFTHGNNAEPMQATPKNVFLTKRWGKPLSIPLLRHPYGSHAKTDLANALARGSKLRKGNYWVGRLEPHWYIYVDGVWQNKWFGIWTIFLWLILPLRHRFSRRWWVRKSAGLWKLFRYNVELMLFSVWHKVRGIDYTDYPRTILQNNDDIDVVFLGHIHICECRTHGAYGTFIYPGNWSTIYDVKWPTLELRWRKWRSAEWLWRMFLAMKMMFNKKTRAQYAPRRRELYSFGVCRFYAGGYKEAGLMRYNPESDSLEQMN